jgi:internalin A
MGSPSEEAGREASEGPTHRVTLSRAFLLGRTEITVGEFREFSDTTGHVTDPEKSGMGMVDNGHRVAHGATWRTPKTFDQSDSHPVVLVSWRDATAYADWRSGQDQLPPCYAGPFDPDCVGWRLPTEAEWEWAARAGTVTPWPGGTPSRAGCGPAPAIDAFAWTCSNAKGTQPVGTRRPNAWGLHDMQGNAWEWVHDAYSDYGRFPITDPIEISDIQEDDRVIRGGGWGSDIHTVRVGSRQGDEPQRGFDNLGFRLARTLFPPETEEAEKMNVRPRSQLGGDTTCDFAQEELNKGKTESALHAALFSLHVARAQQDMASARTCERLLVEVYHQVGHLAASEAMRLHLSAVEGPSTRSKSHSNRQWADRVRADAAFLDARRYACPHEGLGLAWLTATDTEYRRWKGDFEDPLAVAGGMALRKGLLLAELHVAQGRPGEARYVIDRLAVDHPEDADVKVWSKRLADVVPSAPPQEEARAEFGVRTGLGHDLAALPASKAAATLNESSDPASVVRLTWGQVCDPILSKALQGTGKLVLVLADDGTQPDGACLRSLDRPLELRLERADDSILAALGPQPKMIGLDLTGTKVEDLTGVQAPALQRLVLKDSRIDDLGLNGLKAGDALRRVDLRATMVSNEGVSTLAALAPALEELDLGMTDVEHEALATLAGLPLRRLELYDTYIIGDGLGVLPSSLEYLGLGSTDVSDEDLTKVAQLPNLRALELALTEVGDDGIEALSAAKRLQHVGLGSTNVGNSALRFLASLPELRGIYLGDTAIGDSGVRALCDTSSGLRELVLGSTRVSSQGVSCLGKLPELETLELWQTAVTDEALFALGSAKKLRQLSLGGTRVSDRGVGALSQLPALERLELWSTRVGDAGLLNLRAPQLRELDLGNTRVGDAGLAALAAMPQLVELELGGTQVSDDGLDALKSLSALKRLGLRSTRIEGSGLTALKGLTGLRTLRLGLTEVSDEGIAALAGLSDLRDLDLRGTGVGDTGLVSLEGCTELRRLWLDGTLVSDVGLEVLAGFVDLRVLSLFGTRVSDSALLQLKGLRRLRRLDLRHTAIQGEGLDSGSWPDLRNLELAGSPLSAKAMNGMKDWPSSLEHLDLGKVQSGPVSCPPQLQTLELVGAEIDDEDLAGLRSCTELRELQLSATKIGNPGLKHLAPLDELTTLHLGGTQVSNEGLEALDELDSLEELDLWFTAVNDEGLQTLAELGNLQRVNLDGTTVTDEGLLRLREAEELEFLNLGATLVTDAGIASLRRANEQVEISRAAARLPDLE